MEVQGRTLLVLGGAGMVGRAVCRRLLEEGAAHLIVASIDQESAEAGAALVRRFARPQARISACWGNIFVCWELKDLTWPQILASPTARRQLLADLLDPMTGERKREILHDSTLYRFVQEFQPDGIIDCINTATAFAYQNLYSSARELLTTAAAGEVEAMQAAVEQHLCKQYVPHVVRHMQILTEVFHAAAMAYPPGVRAYVKVGTSGTGGMGLNIPYTHGEERPSAVLLSKAAVAGAHSLLLFLQARTPPELPVIKEIKPAAAIGWAQIGYGPIRRRGRPIPLYDCPPAAAYPLAVAGALAEGEFGVAAEGRVLQNVFIDTGENGLFALGEFSTITSLNQMEFVTPEEIADDVVLELRGGNTGLDIISALDQTVLGPTYRAGILREGALARMRHLEALHGVRSIAFELLGPPRLSKLLFEAYLLQQVSGDSIAAVLRMGPETLAAACADHIAAHADLRMQILSIGIPILLPDGERMLRGPQRKAEGAEEGWVDLRPQNMARWQSRFACIQAMTAEHLASDGGRYSSSFYRVFVDPGSGDVKDTIIPGDLAGWIFTYEDQGARMKS
ncbi:MAG: KR domain-containing protein [Caldilineales bacterium]|nr:KR domain-containing protein [Caldilineales bacterium]